ncbi:hypothetical protein ACFHYQ_11360 [Sphaerimonospora cavernae]|uniref:Rod shape-determining protein MreD n=1 Tax=Sphaerimonospora cavernae TaxID=1740611 RepID=A0ABV6U372_9ACTN
MRAFLLAAVFVILAPVVQAAVVNALPWGGPDLALIGVVALAPLTRHGALLGFAAGLAADIAPPADHTIGRHALVLCLAGWFLARIPPERPTGFGTAGRTGWTGWAGGTGRAGFRTAPRPVMTVPSMMAPLMAAPVALGAALLDALLAVLLGDEPKTSVLASLPGSLVWTVLGAVAVSAAIALLPRRRRSPFRSRHAS